MSEGAEGAAGAGGGAKESWRVSSSSERQFKVERAQKCLENAALVSKRIKEHRRAAAELLGKTFEDDDTCDASSEIASTVSTRTGYSVATDTASVMSVEEALNIPGISESLANTLKQKEIIMERIKQFKERSKRPATKTATKTVITKHTGYSTDDETLKSKRPLNVLDTAQLQSTIKEKETAISIMQVKMSAMEATIMDLQEKISEKDSLIEAKTKASSLMSDNLSKKEKDSFSLLEDTRQQMTKMQENFVAMETEWKEDKKRLLSELVMKNERINNLEQANAVLENARFEISLSHSKLTEEIELKEKEITELQDKLANVHTETQEKKETVEEEKGSLEIANMVEMTKRIELLEQLNCQIRQTNVELEIKLATACPESKTEANVQKKLSPQVSRKRGKSASRNPSAKLKSPWSTLAEGTSQELDKPKQSDSKVEMIIQSLNKELVDKEFIISQKEAIIQHQLDMIAQKEEEIKQVSIKPETIDVGSHCESMPELQKREEIKHVISKLEKIDTGFPYESSEYEKDDNEKLNKEPTLTYEELQIQLKAAHDQITVLNKELEMANKNMVKVKSAHKLKMKQMQKTIDGFTKMSDSNAEVSRLSEEVNQLTQKVVELEEDKGNLQLHLVDYDSGRLSESDLHRKLTELEVLAESRLKAISELETQKFDLVQELHILQQKNSEMDDKIADLQQMHNEHVCTEMKSVELEEQLDQITAAKSELELVIENLKHDKDELKQSIKDLQETNSKVTNKLESYIQENIELTDRFEKLSAEKVSSAESIEMVESLTEKEKLELEEYNTKMLDQEVTQAGVKSEETKFVEFNENLVKLSEESAELNEKIELFTQERHEVMENMTKLKSENEELLCKINEVAKQKIHLESQVQFLCEERDKLASSNNDLNTQIEELKNQHFEILKESSNLIKIQDVPIESEVSKEMVESITSEIQSQDDKPQGDKAASKAKSAKQLTKDILKLKNIIKEREAEIADCQMKILSLEEQQQKQTEIVRRYSLVENDVKSLTEENCTLKEELHCLKKGNAAQVQPSPEEIEMLKRNNEALQQAINNTQVEYLALMSTKDVRLQELESLLCDYESRISAYNASLEQKDKVLTDYLNQIAQLNNVSQKLKSTIEVLEEEKAKDQNGELIRTLNKQVISLQAIIQEQETKLKIYEEDLSKLTMVTVDLKEKNANLEHEIQKVCNTLLEKESHMNELQEKQNQHDSQFSEIKHQCKEKDEEIHEIKLQLRKESIENENLRKNLAEFDILKITHAAEVNSWQQKYTELEKKYNEVNANYESLEIKNKELMEKLKKYAVNLKKKTMICADFESQISELNRQIEAKQMEIDNLLSKSTVDVPLLEEIASLKMQINSLKSESLALEKNKILENEAQVSALIEEKLHLQEQNNVLENNLMISKQEIEATLLNNAALINELENQRQQSHSLNDNIDMLNKKLVEYEIENKNNQNFVTKISGLESDVHQKHLQISNLLNQIENIQQDFNTLNFGHEAKIQERDLFIENLEGDLSNYRKRIARLEESISVMEERRHSMERKADQLGCQLEEKQKSYGEYTSQEDELINRLAVLMDHDQVVEKQLHEIERENGNLQNKMQKLIDENQNLQKNLFAYEQECISLKDSLNKMQQAEADAAGMHQTIEKLETQIKKLTADYQATITKQQQDMNNLEAEFNEQIENNIREKKNLNERYEKTFESNRQLEQQLLQYSENIGILTLNLEELGNINKNLVTKAQTQEEYEKKDYTEQYVTEINNLQSIINNNNTVISDLQNQCAKLQADHNNAVSILMSNIKESENAKLQEIDTLKNQLQQSSLQIEDGYVRLEESKTLNAELQNKIQEKDKEISILQSNQRTEQFAISTTASLFGGAPVNQLDLTQLESQIIGEGEQIKGNEKSERMIRAFEHDVKKSGEIKLQSSEKQEGFVEEIIVPKKSYLCYDEEGKKAEAVECSDADPFNSDEGWGFSENVENFEIKHDYTNLMAELKKLSKDNEKLKLELTNTSIKLAKAMKKLKELKLNNDRLSNELRTANQVSQFNLLDNTIEEELKNQIKELDERIAEINSNLNKEKREKEALSKQNEIFKNANEKIMEMKEKLDNEIELWKFKFKEANDKVTCLEWEGNQASGSIEPVQQKHRYLDTSSEVSKECSLIEQLEKENDDLNLLIDQLRRQSRQDSISQSRHKDKISNLREELRCLKTELLQQREGFQRETSHIHNNLIEIQNEIFEINKMSNQKTNEVEDLHRVHEVLVEQSDFLKDKNIDLMSDINILTAENQQLRNEISALNENVSLDQDQLVRERTELIERIMHFENTDNLLKHDLQDKIGRIAHLEAALNTANDNILESVTQIAGLSNASTKLNEENDKLLATVAELRTSVSTAVDQRGYEVAEMWKQHLAQRESDFATFEHELREQLTAAENKYEQLLDKVQSSSQEETNKLIVMEQLTSLQNKLKDKEEHLINLQNKCAQFANELEMLRSEGIDEQLIQDNKLLAQQEYYEKQLADLKSQQGEHLIFKESTIAELRSEIEKNKSDSKLKETQENLVFYQNKCSQLEIEIDALRSEINIATQIDENKFLCQKEDYELQITELKSQQEKLINNNSSVIDLASELESVKALNKQLEFERNELRAGIEMFKNNIAELKASIDIKDSEIYQKNQEFNMVLNQRNEEFEAVRRQLVEYERKIEELSFEKESELAVMRLKLHEHSSQFEKDRLQFETEKDELVNSLTLKIEECTKLNREITDLKQSLEEDSVKMSEVRTVLEAQELEIVTLKDEIDNMQVLLESSMAKVEKRVTFAAGTKQGSDLEIESNVTKELPDSVPTAELDLALYMLHQRDMRCEELTVELTHLLEERDMLQLRLSDCLRSYEEMRSRCSSAGVEVLVPEMKEEVPSSSATHVTAVATHKPSSRSNSVSEQTDLQSKLWELRTLRQSRDVSLRQDSERRDHDMRLLRDVSRLPDAAADQLRQAHYTLSRDSQSASTVLLNWLRGKSTPKVVHM